MTDFKSGGVPTPDYDSDDVNYISEKTEFTDDVFVYGKLYADLGGDVQTFSTAGVERVRITKEGDVAIGTNNPNVTVDASNTSILAVGIVTAREFYGTFKGSIDPSVANDKISEGNTEVETVDTGSNGHIKFITEGDVRARIDSSGNSTFTGNIIVDSGTVRCNDGFSSDVDLIFNADANNNGAGAIIFKESGSEKARITSGGKINIGDADQTQNTDQLSVTIASQNTSDNVARFQSNAAASGTSESLVKIYKGAGYGGVISGYITQGSDHGLKFYTANNGTMSERLRINSSGVVETYGGSGGAALRVKNGGDMEFYAANNSSKVTLHCDTNLQLTVGDKLRFANTSGGILRSNGQHALKPTGACIQTKVTYRGTKFTNSSGTYQVVHSHDFNGIESGNRIGIHLDCDMNADAGGSSWQMMGLRIGSTFYSEKIIEHSAGMNMNASANGLTGAMSAGNHAVQFVTRNGGGTCSYNEANNATGIVLHTYEYVS